MECRTNAFRFVFPLGSLSLGFVAADTLCSVIREVGKRMGKLVSAVTRRLCGHSVPLLPMHQMSLRSAVVVSKERRGMSSSLRLSRPRNQRRVRIMREDNDVERCQAWTPPSPLAAEGFPRDSHVPRPPLAASALNSPLGQLWVLAAGGGSTMALW